jgi:RNA polymerase sigma factor (sigma-70 family)
MTTIPLESDLPDADLVIFSRQGDRTAYSALIARHQSTICALTYSLCGNLHQSQDLAQETFLTAWRHLADLNDPARLLPWLRGIARNLSHSALRNTHRSLPLPVDDSTLDPAPAPDEQAITNEESALLWHHLSRLPETYREPLILYYRENHSIPAVAAALDLTEPAARQRLSRGRALLALRLENLLDRALRQSAPTGSFTLAVTSALPPLSASHTALTFATATKATASSKAASIATSLLGPIAAFASLYFSYRISLDQTIATEERQYLRRFFRFTLLIALAFTILLLTFILGSRTFHLPPSTTTLLLTLAALLYVASIIAIAFRHSRRIRQLRAQLITARPSLVTDADHAARRWTLQYRSRWTFLGLPLLHINLGSTPDLRSRIAVGWIAVGTVAYSPILAFGAISIAPISWGAFSLGLLTYGAVAIGRYAVGALSFGYDAVGVCAIAAHAAQGIVALAPTYADGLSATAAHVNDPAAITFFQSAPLFRLWSTLAVYTNCLYFLPLLPVFLLIRRARQHKN